MGADRNLDMATSPIRRAAEYTLRRWREIGTTRGGDSGRNFTQALCNAENFITMNGKAKTYGMSGFEIPSAPIIKERFAKLADVLRKRSAPLPILVGWYLWGLLAFGLVFHLALPIIVGDTDMWYHLNGGRYFWENGVVPNTPFFSFREPLPEWINYFWGFQAVIYKIHELFGYQGLIVFRSLLFFATTLVIYRYTFETHRDHQANLLPVVLFVALFILIAGRSWQVRPHLISYFFIPFFLYVLEYRPRLAFILPFLTIIWANLHGIEYVVGALICGAYFTEFLYTRFSTKKADPDRGWIYAFAILLCGLAVFVNPHGYKLLFAPFSFSGDITRFISEMAPLSLANLYSFAFSGFNITVATVFAPLFLFLCYSILRGIFDVNLRISHFIIAVGGLYLLSKGVRFIWEWALLSIPLFVSSLKGISVSASSDRIFSVRNTIFASLIIAPFISIGQSLWKHDDYPFSATGLPQGIGRFLNELDVGGNFLTPPSQAGYMQWVLYPKYKIFSDMEFPPFTDFDFFEVSSALRNAQSLQRFSEKYKIDFLSAQKGLSTFQEAVKKVTKFVPVFFDDAQVLYVNRDLHPDIAAKYLISAMDPHNLFEGKGQVEQKIHELKKVEKIDPDGLRVNHALARLLFDEKRYDEALPYAVKYAQHHPLDPNSHYLVGNIFENTGKCGQALEHFRRSMEVSDTSFRKVLNTHIGTCYYVLQDFHSAYDYLRKGLNPYLYKEETEDLFQLAYASAVTGELSEAESLLKMLIIEAEDDDKKIVAEAKALLADIQGDELNDVPGFFSWLKNSLFGK